MKKVKIVLLCVTAAFLVFAVTLGVATRNSYKELKSYDDVEFDVPEFEMRLNSLFEHFDEKEVLAGLKEYDSVFLVTPQEHIRVAYATQTVVHVDKVIKGDDEVKDTSIIIYDDGYISYSKNIQTFYFSNSESPVNNIMQIGKSYLLFCTRQNYHPEFEKRLKYKEYYLSIDNPTMYYFPLNFNKKYINKKEVNNYGDVKDYDYICFTKEQADTIEKLVKRVLKTYLEEK